MTGISASVPIIAVFAGAALGYVSGRLLETRKQLLLQKGQAYADYLRALATAATDPKSSTAQGLAADAKTRICIYGSPIVIRTLGQFERVGARVTGEDGRSAIAQLVKAMRADMDVRGPRIEEADLHLVLFGLAQGSDGGSQRRV